MFRTKVIKRFLAILCVLSLVLPLVHSGIGTQEVYAAEPSNYDGFKKLTFSDLDVADGTLTKGEETLVSTPKGVTWEQTAFSGIFNISSDSSNYLYFGGSNSWNGIRLYGNSEGAIEFQYVEQTANRTDALGGITKDEVGKAITDTEIKLTVTFQFGAITADADGVNRTPVTMNVHIDDMQYATFYIQNVNVEYLDRTIYMYCGSDSQNFSYASSVYGEYLEISQEDFGVADSYTDASGAVHTMPAANLNGTKFHANILFPHTQASNYLCYGVKNGAWTGLRFWVDYDNPKIMYLNATDGVSNNHYAFQEDVAGVAFQGAYVELALSIEYIDTDNTGTEDDVLLGVWFDDVLYGGDYIIIKDFSTVLGNQFLVQSQDAATPYTIQAPEQLLQPDSSLTEVTLTDFGIKDTENITGSTQKTLLDSSLNGTIIDTVLSTKVHLNAGNYFCYAGTGAVSSYWDGLQMIVYADSITCNLVGKDSYAGTVATFTKNNVGVGLIGKEVLLQISIQAVDSDGDGEKNELRLGFFFDGELAGYFYKDTSGKILMAKHLGTLFGIHGNGTAISFSSVGNTAVDELLEVTPADFGVADDTYSYHSGDVAANGILRNEYKNSKEMTLDGKVLSAEVTFAGTEARFMIGGKTSAWEGFWFKRSGADSFTFLSANTKVTKELLLSNTSLLTTLDAISLKISIEYVDRDKDGIKDDVKYGFWLDGSLYNNTYFYVLDEVQSLGNRFGIYSAEDNSSIKISSAIRAKPDNFTEYSLENFGIAARNYNKAIDGTNYAVYGIKDMVLDGSIITGNIILDGNADIRLYGESNNAWSGYQFYIAESGKLTLTQSNAYFNTDERPNGVLAEFDVTYGDAFTFSLVQEYVDADADGKEDDVRMSVWVNEVMYGNKYFYMLDYTECLGNNVMLYSRDSDLTVMDMIFNEVYNLANGSYLLSGKGNITVNGEVAKAGTRLTTPGDYLIVNLCGESDMQVYNFRKQVVLYASGDSHPDGAINILDLVVAKKAQAGKDVATEAGRLGADVDRDGLVEDEDCASVRNALLMEVPSIKAETENATFYTENVMPIIGFFGPYHSTDARGKTYNFITNDIYNKIKRLGVNLITYTNDSYYGLEDVYSEEQIEQSQDILKNLALAEKYGIGMYVHDARLGDGHTDAQLADYISAFNHYSSFKGIAVIDEPFTDDYGGASNYESFRTLAAQRHLNLYKKKVSMLNNITNLIGNVNLNPMYESPAGDTSTSYDVYSAAYQTYLDEYIESCNPRQLSFDYYVFQDSSYAKRLGLKGYFQNLDIVRTTSLRGDVNIPFWTYIQAGDNWNDGAIDMSPTTNDNPAESQLLWNVNTSLAYGAKGIQYFPLIQPAYFAFTKEQDGTLTYDYDRNGLIGADGVENDWYWHAQKANKQVALVDEVLMQSKSEVVLAVGDNAQADTGITTSKYEILESITVGNTGEGAIIGVFDYHGKTAYYVVNYDMSNSQTITLHFTEEQNYSVLSTQMDEENTETAGKSCTLNLKAGGAALVTMN